MRREREVQRKSEGMGGNGGSEYEKRFNFIPNSQLALYMHINFYDRTTNYCKKNRSRCL